MKILFATSFYGKRQYQKFYEIVVNILKSDTIDLKVVDPGVFAVSNKKNYYETIEEGIDWSDGIIFEVSQQDFQLGYEVSYAMENHKPILCLSVNEDFGDKISNKYFFSARYDILNINEIIEGFVSNLTKGQLSERFNLFISPAQQAYLNNVSSKNGMNMSEYIRKLIDDDRKSR